MLILFVFVSIVYGMLIDGVIEHIITKTTNWFTWVQLGVIVFCTFTLYHQFVNISAMIH